MDFFTILLTFEETKRSYLSKHKTNIHTYVRTKFWVVCFIHLQRGCVCLLYTAALEARQRKDTGRNGEYADNRQLIA
jgi:hypothetical protein